MKDYYSILGIPIGSSPETVRKAYRGQVMRYHPDRNPGNPYASAHFQEIQEAYDVLSDYKRREQYHQERNLWKSYGRAFADTSPVTPRGVLSLAIGIRERARNLDLFRINPEGLASDILEILEGDVIPRLRAYPDTDVHGQIVRCLMEAAEPLPVQLLPPLMAQWRALGGSDIEAQVQDYYKRRQREQRRKRYTAPLLFLLTLLICYLIYRLA